MLFLVAIPAFLRSRVTSHLDGIISGDHIAVLWAPWNSNLVILTPPRLSFLIWEKVFQNSLCPLASDWVWPVRGTGEVGEMEATGGVIICPWMMPSLKLTVHWLHFVTASDRSHSMSSPGHSLPHFTRCLCPYSSKSNDDQQGHSAISLCTAHTFEHSPWKLFFKH